jgi:hypothetical protein
MFACLMFTIVFILTYFYYPNCFQEDANLKEYVIQNLPPK